MSRLLCSIVLLSPALLLFGGAPGKAGHAKKKEKLITFYCPVAGMPEVKTCGCPGGYCPRRPDPTYTVDYKGAKIQLCCGQCVTIFKKAPEQFTPIANHQLVATGQAGQFACANCGEDLYTTTQTTVDVAGIPVMFCKAECAKKVMNANPKERVELVFGDKAFSRAFTWKGKK